jgi:hypothetical protein
MTGRVNGQENIKGATWIAFFIPTYAVHPDAAFVSGNDALRNR